MLLVTAWSVKPATSLAAAPSSNRLLLSEPGLGVADLHHRVVVRHRRGQGQRHRGAADGRRPAQARRLLAAPARRRLLHRERAVGQVRSPPPGSR